MLDGLRDRLMAPEIAAEAMRAYAEETNRLNREGVRPPTPAAGNSKMTTILKEIVARIEDGGGSRALWSRVARA